jgi:conjugative relaxase-like TrwC/TraI family protein
MFTTEKYNKEQAVGYFFKEEEQQGYKRNEAESFFGGRGNKFMGETVTEELFRAWLPDKEISARDFTFTAPKSFSVVTELNEELREKLLEIQQNAVCSTMQYIEQHVIATRLSHGSGKDRKFEYVYPGKIEWAAFIEHSSRAGDPNLHNHIVVANRVFVNGKEYSIDWGDVLDLQLEIGKTYREILANGLIQAGIKINITDYKNFFFEIDGIEESTIETFSKRSKEIDEEFKKLKKEMPDKSDAELKEMANLSTRNKKENLETLEELRDRWKKESPQEINVNLVEPARLATEDEIKKAVEAAGRKLTENKSYFSDLALKSYAKQYLISENLTYKEEGYSDRPIEKAIKDMIKHKEFIKIGHDAYTTKEIRRSEKNIIFRAKESSGKFEEIVKKNSAIQEINEYENMMNEKFKLEGKEFKFTNDQKRALEALLTSENGFVVIQGDAGTGKTTLLKAFKDISEKRQIDIVGLSTTAVAVEEIAKQGGIESTKTVEKFILEGKTKKEFEDTAGKRIYIMDESSMISTPKLDEVTSIAEKENARSVLLGDKKQIKSIGAGGMFEKMQKSNDITFIELKESIRQKDQFLKEAVRTIADGHITEGLKMFDEKQKIREIKDKDELFQKMTDKFVSAEDIDNMFMLTAKNKDRVELNRITREKLKDLNKINKEEVKINVRESKNIGDEDKNHIWNYESGDIVVKGKHAYEVKNIDKENSLITAVNVYSGKEINMQANKSNKVYIEADRNFSVNDKIVFLQNDYVLGVRNSNTGYIKNIETLGDGNYKLDVNIAKQNEPEEIISFNTSNYNYFTHAYALTSFKSQGGTKNEAIMYADRTTKNEMYVEVSRARLNVEIFTTDKETLFKTAKKEDKQIDSMTAEKINYGKGKGEKNIPEVEKKIEPEKQKIEPAGIKQVHSERHFSF